MIGQRPTLHQRRELSEIIQTALNLYLENFGPLFTIAAVVIPLGIAGGIFQTTVKNDAIGLPLVGAIAVGQIVVDLIAGAALIAALQDIEAGRAPDVSRAYDLATERFGSLIGSVLRVTFHVILLMITIIGIPWAIQRIVRWLFVQQAVMLDGAKAKEALSRSAEVVIGNWWRTAGIWLLISLLVGVPSVLVAGLFSLAPVAVSSTAAAVVSALLLPFFAFATTLLYFDLQARKESHAPVSAA